MEIKIDISSRADSSAPKDGGFLGTYPQKTLNRGCVVDNTAKQGVQTKRRYLHYIAYTAAIILLIGVVVYAVLDQARFADALVESFVE